MSNPYIMVKTVFSFYDARASQQPTSSLLTSHVCQFRHACGMSRLFSHSEFVSRSTLINYHLWLADKRIDIANDIIRDN